MSRFKAILSAICFISAFQVNAVDIAPFGVEADFEFRSAYQSRMRISEDRPVFVMDVSVYADAGSFGRFGIRNWNRSSLCNRYSHVHRRAFNEIDYGVFWQYDVKLTDDFTLSNEFIHWWITEPQNIDPYRGKNNSSTYELWYVAALKNPYLIPSLFIRRAWLNDSWVYFRYGVTKPFTVCDFGDATSPQPLVITPGIFVETADSGVYESRFGKKKSGSYHTGIGSCIAQISLKWKASENLTFHGTLQQFGLVSSDARDGVHGNYHRDYTMFRFGMNLKF